MIILVIALSGLLASKSVSLAAEPPRIDWNDLIPAFEPLPNPLDNVDMSVRFDIAYAGQVRADIAKGAIDPHGAEARNANTIAKSIEAQGYDIEPLIEDYLAFSQEIGRRSSGLVDDLLGKRITLPGYALPLEMSPEGVQEFLLVPYVGACIHVPPPPPNQMVYVTSEEAVQFEGLFQAVQVTGLLTSEQSNRSLSFVDGSDDVTTGYTLTDVIVHPHSE